MIFIFLSFRSYYYYYPSFRSYYYYYNPSESSSFLFLYLILPLISHSAFWTPLLGTAIL